MGYMNMTEIVCGRTSIHLVHVAIFIRMLMRESGGCKKGAPKRKD